MDTFGDRLKEERERVGLTQVALAELAGASKSAQVGWESGRSVPNASYLAVAIAQGIDVIYVLTGVRMDEATRSHLTRAIQFSVQLGDQDLTEQSIQAAERQADEIREAARRRKDLIAKVEKLSEADVGLLLQMADRIAKP